MRLTYVANIRLPTEKAHGIQIMEMCKAFASLGYDVELIVPKRATTIKDDPFEYYSIDPIFKIKKLWCLDTVRWGRVGFLLESLSFAKRAAWYAFGKGGLFYTRDELVAFYLKIMSRKVVWEAHMGHTNLFARLVLKLNTPLVVITRGLKDLYVRFGVPESHVHVAPDGVEVGMFDAKESKIEAREKLGFEQSEKIVLYTGHLFSWKGADTLAEAAQLLGQDKQVVFIGGTENDVASFKERFGDLSNIRILGKKPHHEIPLYLRAADVLMIPNSAKEDISKFYTSPMKLFEYMASGTPIIASNLPSIREVLDDSTAYFAEPDNAQSLAQAIERVFDEYATALIKAQKALEEAERYSWKERAAQIINFIT